MRVREDIVRRTHVASADAPTWLVDKAFGEEIEAVGGCCAEEVAQGCLGEVPEMHVVRQLGMALADRLLGDAASGAVLNLLASLLLLVCRVRGRWS